MDKVKRQASVLSIARRRITNRYSVEERMSAGNRRAMERQTTVNRAYERRESPRDGAANYRKSCGSVCCQITATASM